MIIRRPLAKHWLSHATIVALLPTIITVGFSLLALRPPQSEQLAFLLYIVVGVVLTVVVWRSAANHERKVEAAQVKAESAQAITKEILDRISKPEPPAIKVEKLSSLSDDEIRAAVRDVAQRMRAMESSFKRARDNVIYGDRSDWQLFTRRMAAQSTEQANRWGMDLRSRAVSLWQEMQRRIHGVPPYPSDERSLVALEHGMLAGVNPLGEAADLLEDMAQRLSS